MSVTPHEFKRFIVRIGNKKNNFGNINFLNSDLLTGICKNLFYTKNSFGWPFVFLVRKNGRNKVRPHQVCDSNWSQRGFPLEKSLLEILRDEQIVNLKFQEVVLFLSRITKDKPQQFSKNSSQASPLS